MDAALYRLVGDNFVAGGITMNNYENNHENDDTTTSFTTIQATLWLNHFYRLANMVKEQKSKQLHTVE